MTDLSSRWQPTLCVVKVVNRQTDLFQMVAALYPPSRFTGRLHRGQEQCDEDRYDGDDHQQFNQGKSATS